MQNSLCSRKLSELHPNSRSWLTPGRHGGIQGRPFGVYLAALLCITLSISFATAAPKRAPAAPQAPGVVPALDTPRLLAESLDGVQRRASAAPQPKVGQPAAPSNEAPSPNAITATTYAFTSSSGAALEDMSSSTALLLPADLDNTASNFGSIPFDFWFDGVRQNIFSVDTNGFMRLGTTVIATTATNSLASTTNSPQIAPYWDDLWVGTGNGKVHYKTVGTAPNRKLVVEWFNMQIPRVATATAGAGTFQVWLWESTGVIEFVYGTGMAANATNSGYSVGIQAGAATNFASVTTSSNTVSYVTANDNNTGAIAAGTKYTFTPNIPAAPTGLNFTAVGLNTMTLNWTDNATNEFGYAIYRSLDGVTYEFVTQTAANATFSVQAALASNTTYFWRVIAVSEGGQSSALSGSQATTTGTAAGTISVGPTGTFTSLTAAVTSLNATGLAGNVILELQAAYTSGGETFPLVINTLGSPSNTITIRPVAGASGLSITSANATGTIDLNTATNVTIDGRAGGVGPSQLSISNTVTTGFAVRLINGASRNTIQYCTIAGVETSASLGVVFFSTTTGATGNNNNNINNCDIRDGATTPVNCVLGLGTVATASLNTGNTITQNNVFNFFNAATASNGINANNGSNWTITNNRVFQTAARASTAAITHRGILVLTQPGFDNTISNNVVGFANAVGTGTYTMTGSAANGFVGIQLQGSITQTNSIQGNTVAGISMSTTGAGALTGVSVTGGSANVGTVTGNTVGAGVGTGSIIVTDVTTAGAFLVGMNVSTSTGHVNVANNTIGSLTATGSPATVNPNLNVTQMTGGSMSITNNIFGSTTTPNSIQITTAGTTGTAQQLIGMLSGSTNPMTISGNIMSNLTNAGTGTAHVIRGIQFQSPGLVSTNANGKCSIVANVVNNLTGSNASVNTFGNTVGIFYTTSAAAQPNGGLIDSNTVNTISATNAGAVATVAGGIYMSNPAGAVVSNNKVYDIRNASTGTTATTPPVAFGIEVQAGPTFLQMHNNMVSLGNAQATNTEFIGLWNNFNTIATIRSWFNSVHIEGAVGAGALPSYCFLRGDNTAASAIASPVDLKNSIYDNARTGGTGKHYAIGNVNSVPVTGWSATASNNNTLNSASAATVGIFGLAADKTFATWKNASGGDGASISGVSVVFANVVTGDLHLSMGANPTALESGGTTLAVTTDFDNQTRPGPPGPVNGGGFAPDIGADEFDGAPSDIVAPVISYTPLSNTLSTADRVLTATITDATGAPTTGSLVPRIYYKKNAGSYFSQPGSLSSGNGNNGTWSFTIVVADVGGVVSGDVISYFVIAQDTLGNIESNPAGVVATDVNTVTTPPGVLNTYLVQFSISGTKTVGSGGDFPSLTGANGAITGPGGINNAVITGPVVLNLIENSNSPEATETYPITINANSSASSTNTVTIKPNAPGTTMTGTPTTGTLAIFVLNGADYVTIDGSSNGTSSRDLTITNSSSSTASAVIWLQTTTGADAATNNTVKNLNIVGSGNTQTLFGIGCGSGTTGISTASLGTGNNNNTFQNNNISKTQYGIYSQGASAANKNTGTVINGNLINAVSPNNVSKGGVWVGFEDSIVISGNTVSEINQTSSPDVFGISLGFGTSMSATTTAGNDVTNAIVSKNIIGNIINSGTFSAYGIGLSAVTTGTSTISNNVIYGVTANGTSGDFGGGIVLGGGIGSTTRVFYNSVSFSGTIQGATAASQVAACLAVTASTAPTLDIRDNILSNTQLGNASATVRFVSIGLGYSSTTGNYAGLTSNNNDLYCTGAGPGTYQVGETGGLVAGTVRTTLANWQTETGRDANSVSGNPQFNSNTDLHINPSVGTVVESTATPIAGITTDIDGDTRNATTPDIGADEGNFTAVVSNDMQATAFVDPVNGGSKLANTAFSPQASFTNNGLSTQTSVTVRYRICTDGTCTTELYNNTQIIASIGSGNSTTITFASVVGGLSAGTYTMKAKSELGGDQVPANDEITGTFTVQAPLTGNYTVGAGGNYPSITQAVNALNNLGVSGPVVLNLTDSSYTRPDATETYPIQINAIPGASSTNTVKIKPAAGNTVTITASLAAAASSVFILNGASFVTIDGSNNGTSSRDLTITNNNTSASSAVIWLQTTTGAVAATNNVIKNANLVGTSTTATPATLIGVGSGSSTISITSTGTGNNNNQYQNCNISKTQYGIYSGGASAANKNTGTVITQNLMNAASPNNITTGGILVNFENAVQITQNNIDNVIKHDGTNGTTTTAFGIALGVVPNNTVTTFTGSDVTNATVTGNKIGVVLQLNSTGYSAFGIVVNSVTSGTTRVANNMISGIRAASTASDFSAGIVAGGGTGSTTQVYFNSVSMTGSRNAATYPSYGLAINSGDPIVDVRNNIFFNTQSSTSSGKMYAIATGGTTFVNLTSNNNDLFVSGTSTFVGQTGGLGTAGTDRTALSDWQTATGRDTPNSISANPGFVSATDLHLTMSPIPPVSRAGVTIFGVTTDIDGDTRQSPPDMGADEIITYVLTYTAGANGSILGATPQQVIPGGSGTAVTAVPNACYHFVNWSDGSTQNPRTDTNVMADLSVTANFSINTYTLTYTAGPNGSITGASPQTVNCGSNGTAVTAVPNACYHFVNWSDGSTQNPRTDTNVMADVNVTANFAINTYTLTYTAGPNGSITGASPQTVNCGSDGTAVTAVPNACYHFVNWSDGSTQNPRTDTNVMADITVTANFAINTYTLTYTAGPNGSISGTSPQTVNCGGSGSPVTAVPDPGYAFHNWSDASTANPRTDTNVTADINVTANFVSTNANLSNLVLSQGTLQPAFDPNILNYTAAERHRTTSITLTPTVQDANATITVNGLPVPSGQQSQSIPLNVGNNTITVVVYAQDEGGHPNAPLTTKTYTIIANRADVPVVTNTNDSGAGSLRDALDDVFDGETITFSIAAQKPNVAQVITLTSGELVVNNSVTISGPGANMLTVMRDPNAAAFRIYHIMPGKSVAISGMTISGGNSGNANGGGILNDHATLAVASCTLAGNVNALGYGGGIYNDGLSGAADLTIINSTLSGNASPEGSGGGIFNEGSNGIAHLTINNSTLSGNSSLPGTGGAIVNKGASGTATLTIANSTLAGNSADAAQGGGIWNQSASLTLGNTMLKKGSSGANIANSGGTVTSAGYNLSDDNGAGFLTNTGDQIDTDPMLGPLKDNGGTTLTHAPLIGSPAIDQGKRNAIPALTTNVDQRGFVRPVDDPTVTNAAGGDASDIGAVELQQFVHPNSSVSRKTHPGFGDFDVNLPTLNFASSPLGIECRTGGASGVHRIIVTFAGNVTFTGAAVTSGSGSVSSTSGSGTNQLTINLNGITDIQTITVGLFDVNDGSNSTDVGTRMGVLLGDVNGNKSVNAADVSLVKSNSGSGISAANFRSDVNVNGAISAADVSLVKSKSGNGLP